MAPQYHHRKGFLGLLDAEAALTQILLSNSQPSERFDDTRALSARAPALKPRQEKAPENVHRSPLLFRTEPLLVLIVRVMAIEVMATSVAMSRIEVHRGGEA